MPMREVMSKPTVNVFMYGSASAASAVMLPESMPPLRCAPTGTSLTSCRRDGLPEEPVELLLVLLVGCASVVRLAELEVPVLPRAGGIAVRA